MSIDKAVQYVQTLDAFVALLNTNTLGRTYAVESGRKFDKVFINGAAKVGRYMVDRNSWIIYATKSWNQYNPRRSYGNLEQIDQWNWNTETAPIPNAKTDAETELLAREATIKSGYARRGRPRKVSSV